MPLSSSVTCLARFTALFLLLPYAIGSSAPVIPIDLKHFVGIYAGFAVDDKRGIDGEPRAAAFDAFDQDEIRLAVREGMHEAHPLRLQVVLPQRFEQFREAEWPVHEAEAAAAAEKLRGRARDVVESAEELVPRGRDRAVRIAAPVVRDHVRRVGDDSVHGRCREVILNLPDVTRYN